VAEQVAKLAQRHSAVLDIFKELPNRQDLEACEELLFDESVRDKFYEALTHQSLGRETPEQVYFNQSTKEVGGLMNHIAGLHLRIENKCPNYGVHL